MKKTGNFRWIICALLFAITAINYMDRQIIGLLKPMLEREFNWTEVDYSNIVATFQVAYAVGSILMGMFIDKIGVRRGMVVVAFFWSLATAAHAFVYEFDLWGLTITSTMGFMFARIGLGIFEGGNFPAAIRSVSTWFPRREVALATGVFNSGSNVGAIVAPIIVPLIASFLGWRLSFVTLGVMGMVWILFWIALYSTPEKSKFVSPAERDYIAKDPAGDGVTQKKIPWISLLKYNQVRAFAVGMFISSPIWWFYLFWMPSFLHRQFNLEVHDQMPLLATIYLMACFGSVGGGWISSKLIASGKSLNFSRKTALLICALFVCPVFFAPHTSSPWLVAILVGFAGAAHQGYSANLYSVVGDVAPKNIVASITGLGTTCASIGAIALSKSVGYILDATNNNYTLIFAFASVAYVVATLLMHVISPKLEKMQ